MAQPLEQPQSQTLLIPSNANDPQNQRLAQGDDGRDPHLDQTLKQLETLLSFLGFCQFSLLSFALSWIVFLFVGAAIPVLLLVFFGCTGCERYQIEGFQLHIVVSQACLAAVSFICLSHNLRKYGLRRFLFVDRYSGQMIRFRDEYIEKISGSLRLLVLWIIPCFIMKIAREVIRAIYVDQGSWWLSTVTPLTIIISWTYLTAISLLASILFHLLCNLQVIHFDDYAKLLERETDVVLFIEEHIRLRHYLSKISHRFRIFLLLQCLVVTASQFVTLVMITGYSGVVTFINGADFAVSSIVQVVGITFCLHAATKISHRAQSIGSLASRWHALITCSSADGSQLKTSNGPGNFDTTNPLNSLYIDYSESDLESVDYLPMPKSIQFASYVSSYHKRHAFDAFSSPINAVHGT